MSNNLFKQGVISINMNQKKAISQLMSLKKLTRGSGMRLAAEGWDEKWKVLISTILSAQTRDETTIKYSEILFDKYNSIENLAHAKISEVRKIIKPINYHKTKARHIVESAKIIDGNGGKIPEAIEGLLELPGVGRKVGNVYLAEAHNSAAIGVDTHVGRISQKLGWSKNKNPHKIEEDLKELFPKRYWRSINYILVSFGRGHTRKEEDVIFSRLG